MQLLHTHTHTYTHRKSDRKSDTPWSLLRRANTSSIEKRIAPRGRIACFCTTNTWCGVHTKPYLSTYIFSNEMSFHAVFQTVLTKLQTQSKSDGRTIDLDTAYCAHTPLELNGASGISRASHAALRSQLADMRVMYSCVCSLRASVSCVSV